MLRFAARKFMSHLGKEPINVYIVHKQKTSNLKPVLERINHSSYCTDYVQKEPNIGVDSEAKTVDSLLKKAEKRNLLATSACQILISLAELKKNEKLSESDYLQNEQFLKTMKVLEGTFTSKVHPLTIVGCLKALTELGINNESFTVKNLETTLTWYSRSCSIKVYSQTLCLEFCI